MDDEVLLAPAELRPEPPPQVTHACDVARADVSGQADRAPSRHEVPCSLPQVPRAIGARVSYVGVVVEPGDLPDVHLVWLGAVVDAKRVRNLTVCVTRGIAVLEHGLDARNLEPTS